jgi:hypothetical protein
VSSVASILKELAASSFAAGGGSSILHRYVGKTAHCQVVKIALTESLLATCNVISAVGLPLI